MNYFHMALIALRCPNCSGDLEFKEGLEFGFCQYCGTKILLQETVTQKISVDNSQRVKNLLLNAEDYYGEGFKDRALIYSSQAVDLDRSCSKAWFIKAMCSEDYADKVVSLKNALKYCQDEELIQKINNELNNNVRVDLVPSGILIGWLREKDFPILIDGKKYSLHDNKSLSISKGKHMIGFLFNGGEIVENTVEITTDCKLILNMKDSWGSVKFKASLG